MRRYWQLVALLLVVIGVAAVASLPTATAARMAPAPGLTVAADAAIGSTDGLPVPAIAARTTAWVAPGYGRFLVDDFESGVWPNPELWPVVVDLTAPGADAYFWAPTDCLASDGARSLWSVAGGTAGSSLACGAEAPDGRQTSAILGLDLSALRSAGSLHLLVDIWADAAPTEGLLLNYLDFGPDGVVTQRRVVFSATGRSVAWSREVSIDLTSLRDRRDPGWTGDLRGQFAYLEFLFLSDAGAAAGTGIYVDNVRVESALPTPIVVSPVPSPSPTPAATEEIERTEACTTEPDCRLLQVWSYVDYRCDRRFQPGVDERVTSRPRIDIVAGSERLGTRLDARGYATFRLLSRDGATIEMTMPDGYQTCDNSPNPVQLAESDFSRYGLTQVEFRLRRTP